MRCTTIEEALKYCNEVTNLDLSGEACKEAYTDEIEKLVNLKSLHFSPKLEEWSSFPKGFKKLNLEVLHIKGVRINELIGLKIKNLGINIASIDILPLCKNFPEIEELSLIINEEFAVPKEIEQLSKLKKLSIRRGSLTEVANEIGNLKELKTLNLHSLKFETLPLAFTNILTLETLSLNNFSTLIELPEEIKNWQKLKTLYLQDCFQIRKKPNIKEEFVDKYNPIELPAALAGLKNLQEFKITFCPVKNLNPLADLTNLESIKIVQAHLENINALEKLTKLKKLEIGNSYNVSSIESLSKLTNLEYLDIQNTKVKDLKPLSKLTNLGYLNVIDCSFDKSKSKLQDALLPIYAFENLKKVEAFKMTQKEWEERDPKEALKKKLSSEEIIKVLENKNSKLKEVEEVLNVIGDLETVFKVNKYDAGDSYLEIPVLDTAVTSHVERLNIETLKKIISVSFADTGMGDSYEVTTIVVEEIIRRKSIEGQKHVVKAFINCCTFYDAGHRYHGSTVQDQLIDNLFPDFEIEPLVELMLSIEDSLLHPEYGDDMCSLYPEVFSKMKNGNEHEEVILTHLTSYIFEDIHEELVVKILDKILDKEISENSKKAIEKLKNTTSIINKAIEGESITDFEIMLQEVDRSIPLKIFADFELEEAFCELSLQEMSYRKLQTVFILLIASKGDAVSEVTHQIIKVLFLLDENRLEEYLINSVNENDEIKERLIQILSEEVSGTEENYVDKIAYEEFALKNKYKLQGKSKEDVKREIAEKKAESLRKEAAKKQKFELDEAFNQSLKGVDNTFFIDKSEETIANELLNDYSFDMANFTTKLLINSLQHGDFISAKNVFIHFTEKLLSVVGSSNKQDDVASNAIVLALMSKDKEVASLVFEKLMAKNFKVTDINNEVLAFNLCCYYAFSNDKESMLAMIKQSLNLGKEPKQFKEDTDFSVFWEDQDFIDVLNS